MSNLLSSDIALRWRRTRFNPIRTLKPVKLAQALDEFDYGYLRQCVVLWEMIQERDDVLQIVVPKRKKAVSRRPFQVLTVNGDETPEAHTQRDTLLDFWKNIKVTDATDLNVKGGFALLVRQMMSAAFNKYCVHEVIYKPTPKGLRAEFRYVPLYFFENLSGKLRYIGPEGGVSIGTDLADGEWLVTTCDAPIMKAASICYMFKRLSLQDWLNFSEKFGVPGIHGKTAAQKGTKEFDDFVAALETFANDWIAATNNGAEITLIEAKGTGDQPFAPMVERMDRRLAALCMGADLSTLSRTDATGASLQGDGQDLLIEDDCQLVTETLESISEFVLKYTFDTDEPLAFLRVSPPQQKDIKGDVAVDQFLLDNGGELDGAETYGRYNRQAPEGMPEGFTLKKSAATAPQPVDLEEEEPAENDRGAIESGDAPAALLHNALADALGVVPQWLAPISNLITALESKAADQSIAGPDMVAFLERAAESLPELFGKMDRDALADELEAATGTAVIGGVVNALRTQKANQ